MNSVNTFASTVKEDLIQALGVFYGEGTPPGGYFSREMVTLYAFVFISSALVLKPVRKLLYSAIDTLVAVVLLGVIGSVVLGIPFGTNDILLVVGMCREYAFRWIHYCLLQRSHTCPSEVFGMCVKVFLKQLFLSPR